MPTRISCPLFAMVVLTAMTSPAAAQILPPGGTPALLAGPYNFTEGPVYDGNGGMYFTNLVFSNQANSDIIRYDIASKMAQVVDPSSGGSNGLYLDAGGQLVSADQATHQISRRSAADITVVEQVLANEWNSMGFNSPNDLVIDAAGGIYFTDPDYNNVRAQPDAVYYRDPQGMVSRILTGFNRPNGIVLSPGGGTLYVAIEQEFRIMAYDVGPDGLPTNEREFVKTNVNANGTPLPGINNGPDGMTIDAAGNVYAAVQNAVFGWNPAGERVLTMSVPQNPQNAAFGGEDGRTLFITAGNSLYGVELNVPSPQNGDYNGDGTTDAADYVTWRQSLNETENLAADGNGNRMIDEGDYTVWQDNFGKVVSGGAGAGSLPVPEPASLSLLSGLMAAAAPRRWLRRCRAVECTLELR